MSQKQATLENKRALHNYFVVDRLECGISLWGNEVKSIRYGMASIKEAWCRVQDGSLVIRGMRITKWGTANNYDIDENRERQLLAHKKEIKMLSEKCDVDGFTLIPLRVYFVKGKCKVEVGICKGKKLYDKREALRNKDVSRDINRAFKEANKNG